MAKIAILADLQAYGQGRALLDLLCTRGVGHTSLMNDGLANYRGDAIVVGATAQQGMELLHFRRQTRDMYKSYSVGLDSIGSTRGLRAAVAVDHHAIVTVLRGLLLSAESAAEYQERMRHG